MAYNLWNKRRLFGSCNKKIESVTCYVTNEGDRAVRIIQSVTCQTNGLDSYIKIYELKTNSVRHAENINKVEKPDN